MRTNKLMPRKKKIEETTPGVDKPIIELAKMAKTPQLVKGMKDILPQEQPYWDAVRDVIERITRNYGFSRMDTPLVEDLALYTHAVGRQTDIVEKEMYTMTDLGGNTLALRPEFTAAIARAYIEHGMVTHPQPVKLFTVGALFRYDKPQEGRYRQHHQFNCEIVGEGKPAVDAQLIFMAHKFFSYLGIPSVLHINSIGCLECRAVYRATLTEFYRSKRSLVCEDCKRRLAKNPLRLLDCKVETCQPVKALAPHIVDSLCELCKDHFMGVLESIDEFEIPYQHNPHLVRGLDYYSRTVFEFQLQSQDPEASQKNIALGGGGRWDNLIEVLGGQPTPACGFGLGIERTILALKSLETARGESLLPVKPKPQIFVAQLGEQAKRRSMLLFESILDEGFTAASEFSKDSLKAQLEIANRLGVEFTIILGQKELIDGTIIIRNMEGGEQEVVDIKKLIPVLRKKLTHEHGEGSTSTPQPPHRKEGEIMPETRKKPKNH